MRLSVRTVGVVAPLVFSLLACKAVTIVSPTAGLTSNAPVTSFAVQFDKNIAPGTFRAWLDGQDITDTFSAPSPFVLPGMSSLPVSSAAAPPFEGGTAIVLSNGYGRGDVTTDTYKHKLVVYGEIPGNSFNFSDEHEFTPPTLVFAPVHFVFGPTGFNLDPTIPREFEVGLPVPPPGPVQVTITPNNSSVSLDWGEPGIPLEVTIPVTARATTFTLHGASPGFFSLTGTASGCQTGSLSGSVIDKH
jgi:hypothetical protein